MAVPKSPTEVLREGSVIEPPNAPTSHTEVPLSMGVIGDSPLATKSRQQRALGKHSRNTSLKIDTSAIPFSLSQTSTSSGPSPHSNFFSTPTSTSSNKENGAINPNIQYPSATHKQSVPGGPVIQSQPGSHIERFNRGSHAVGPARAMPVAPQTVNTQPSFGPPAENLNNGVHSSYCSKNCPCGGTTNITSAKRRKSGRLQTMLD